MLIYGNDLYDNLHCRPKIIYWRQTHLAFDLNNDLKEINICAFQRKVCFNQTRQNRHKKLFSVKNFINAIHPQVFFNNIPVSKVDYQKHLEIMLDYKLIFGMHIKTIRA